MDQPAWCSRQGKSAPNAANGSMHADANEKNDRALARAARCSSIYMSNFQKPGDYGFAGENRMVRAVWTVHPLCKNVKLMV